MNTPSVLRTSAADYEAVLNAFEATTRRPAECVKHLVSLGYSVGQARSAVYRYRGRHGLLNDSAKQQDARNEEVQPNRS